MPNWPWHVTCSNYYQNKWLIKQLRVSSYLNSYLNSILSLSFCTDLFISHHSRQDETLADYLSTSNRWCLCNMDGNFTSRLVSLQRDWGSCAYWKLRSLLLYIWHDSFDLFDIFTLIYLLIPEFQTWRFHPSLINNELDWTVISAPLWPGLWDLRSNHLHCLPTKSYWLYTKQQTELFMLYLIQSLTFDWQESDDVGWKYT